MNNQQETLSRFGKKFQENMCQLMLEDRPFYDQISEVLKIEFFELKYLQVFAETLMKYRSKYSTHPNHEVMMSILRTELNHYDDAAATQRVVGALIEHRAASVAPRAVPIIGRSVPRRANWDPIR